MHQNCHDLYNQNTAPPPPPQKKNTQTKHQLEYKIPNLLKVSENTTKRKFIIN